MEAKHVTQALLGRMDICTVSVIACSTTWMIMG